MHLVAESNQTATGLGTNLRHLEIGTFNCLSKPLRISNKRNFSELHEGMKGNHARGLYSTLSCCALWAGAWRLNPTASDVFKTSK